MHCHTLDWYAFAKAAFALAVGIGASNAWGQSFEVTLQQFLSSNPQVSGVVATVDSPMHRLEWSGAAGLAGLLAVSCGTRQSHLTAAEAKG
jgi:hypothetical protein